MPTPCYIYTCIYTHAHMVYTILCIYINTIQHNIVFIQRVYGHKHVICTQYFIRLLQYIHTMYEIMNLSIHTYAVYILICIHTCKIYTLHTYIQVYTILFLYTVNVYIHCIYMCTKYIKIVYIYTHTHNVHIIYIQCLYI